MNNKHFSRPKIAAYAILLLFISNAYAQDHLEPEESQFFSKDVADYYQLQKEYFDAFRDGVPFRVVVNPSFGTEYAVWLTTDSDSAFINYEQPNIDLYGFNELTQINSGRSKWLEANGKRDNKSISSLQRKYPKAASKIPKHKARRKIDTSLAVSIYEIWRKMIFQTKYSLSPQLGLDGISYHFGAFVLGKGYIEGQTWSPSDSSNTGTLIRISELLKAYSIDGDSKIIEEIQFETVRLGKMTGADPIPSITWQDLKRLNPIRPRFNEEFEANEISRAEAEMLKFILNKQ